MKKMILRALASFALALLLTSCGGGDQPASKATRAEPTRRAASLSSDAPLYAKPTVTILNWRAHDDGVCGMYKLTDPLKEFSFDVAGSTSDAVIDAFVAKMQTICDGHLAGKLTSLTKSTNSLYTILGDVYIIGGVDTYSTAQAVWGEGIKQDIGGAPYGTVSCPLGYQPEFVDSFNNINRGVESLLFASNVGCKLLPNKFLSAKNLGVPEACVHDPINQATGNEFKVEVDFTSSTPMGLSLVRVYNSDASAGKGMFGAHWTTAFDRQLLSTAGVLGYREAVRPDGRRIGYTYKSNADGWWTTLSDIRDTLQQTTGGTSAVTGWRYVSAPDDMVEMYDASGLLVSVTNRAGLKTTYSYTAGRLTTVTDPFGRTLTFTYGANGYVSTVTDALNRVYSFGYDSAGNLTSVTYPDAKVKRYVYNELAFTGGTSLPNAMTGVIDEAGQRFATISYNSQGMAVGSELADGAGKGTVVYEQDASGFVTKATASVGAAASSVYDVGIFNGKAQVTNTTAPCWASGTAAQKVDWPYQGVAGSRVDFNGVRTNVVFDSTRKNEISRSEAVGTTAQREITTEWHPTFRLPTKITEPGRASEFVYDAVGNLTSKTLRDTATGASRTWTYTYNASGQVLTIDGPRTDVADVTTFTYDLKGNVATMTDALGRVTKFTAYDALGRLRTMSDPNGLNTFIYYDNRNRLQKISVGPEDTLYAYNANGDLAKVTYPSGASLTYGYDRAHRLTSIADAEGSKIVYTLDVAGNRTKEEVFDAAGSVVQTKSKQFDAMNQLVKLVSAYGQTTAYSYDANGNLTGVDDPLHHGTTFAIDQFNRVKSITDAARGVQTQTFDTNDKLRRIVDAKGYASELTVNALGDTSEVSLPAEDGQVTDAIHDGAGNLRSKTDFRGVITTYTYDALNRLTSISAPGATTITFTYDEGTNGIGHLTRMNDAAGVTRWTYDIFGRVLSELRTTSGMTIGPRYVRVPGGQISTIVYPSGRTIGYAYTRGQLTNVTVDGVVLASSFKTQPLGGVAGWTWASGQVYQRTFDLDGRITSYPMGSGKQTLGRDAAGRITDLTDSLDGTLNQTFGYDELDRVVSYGGPDGTGHATSERYVYDANGNRTSITILNRNYAYGYSDGQNQLASVAGPAAQTWSGPDIDTITDGTHAYSFDAYLRQIGTTTAGVKTSYVVDGLGKRVSKIAPSLTTHYIYGPSGELLAEMNAAAKATIEYVWLPSQGGVPQPIAVSAGSRGPVNYIFSDHLNTPRMVTNPTGTVLWRWVSDPFGNTAPQVYLGGFPINLRFAGQYFDAESGLHYNWHRYYDPRTGRYTTSDPIGVAGGINTYAYVDGNSISRTDPRGLCPWCVGVYIFLVENSATIGTATVITAEIASGVPNPVSSSASFAGRAAQELTHDVYFGIKAGEPVYVGITKDLACRAAQHGDRFERLMRVTPTLVTKDQARAIEQALINNNPQFQNQINSIAESRSWYDHAVEWGQHWLSIHR